MEDLTFKGLIIVITAFYVAWSLPTWVKKLTPLKVGKKNEDIPEALRLAIIAGLSLVFSTVLWVGLFDHLNLSLGSMRKVVLNESMQPLSKLFPDVILAILSIALVFGGLKWAFVHLSEPKNLNGALFTLGAVLLVFYLGDQLWGVIAKYFENNLNGSAKVYQSEPFQILDKFFSTKE